MEQFSSGEGKQFQNVAEELAFLRGEIAKREAVMATSEQAPSREKIAETVVEAYRQVAPEKVLHQSHVLPAHELEALVLNLRPEEHDGRMEDLLAEILAHGVKNALSIVAKKNDPHLDDDFHRFLVQYLLATHGIPGLKEKSPLEIALHMKLFEITFPEGSEERHRSVKEMMIAMEQFFAGMQSVGSAKDNEDRNYYTLEIALAEDGNSVVFYAAVPGDKASLFERNILGVCPTAKIAEVGDDYNVFSPTGHAKAAEITLRESRVLPIRMQDYFEEDSLTVLLAFFGRLHERGVGAALQIIVRPGGESFARSFMDILGRVRAGTPLKKAADNPALGKMFLKTLGELALGSSKEEDKPVPPEAIAESSALLSEKLSSTLSEVAMRIVVSHTTEIGAEMLLRDFSSTFDRFSNPKGNSFSVREVKGSNLADLLHEFSFRLDTTADFMPLNFKELSAVFHFPEYVPHAHGLKRATMHASAAPLSASSEHGTDAILLGTNDFQGANKNVYMNREDRMRHMYVIGQTGTGKTNFLKSMILQDIANGDGVCYMDPHGTDVQEILANIPPHRVKDVIYFDPSYTARPMALNMLEFDPRYPEQKTRVVDELLGIFRKLFGAVPESMGPAFEQYFRNAALLVMEHPESGSTLLEIGRVMSDKAFRELKLSHCQNPIIKQFWVNAEKTTGEAGLANYVPYITNKFDVFVANEIMRPIIAQEKSSFNVREIMDNKKILLVNLAKGRLGDINANLIGLILVGKIQMAALSRVDMYGQKMSDFFLYIDEFQNITTDSIASIFSEARKYRLSLTVAHQYITQLEENIKNAVFGNVGTMAVFRIDQEDAKKIEGKYTPTFTWNDLAGTENYYCYMNMLVNGTPERPFNLKTLPVAHGTAEVVAELKELSYLTYGRDRAMVETEVLERYLKKAEPEKKLA